MLAVLVGSSIRAVLLIAAVALVLRVMRIRAASVRHAAWAGVVVVMLVLPLTVAWGPKVALRWLPASPERIASPLLTAPATTTLAVAESVPVAAPQVEQRHSWTWESYLEGLYFAGLALFLLRLGIGTLQVQRLMRVAVVKDGQRMHPSCTTPITVGCVTPMVILPPQWREWPEAQLNAVLAHENAHVSRRDPLFQYIGLLNRAVFWFHPLAWWLDRQLSGLAEEACDDIVLSQGYDPREYSEYLVSIARSLQGNDTRTEMVGMAMPGAALPHRVQRMLGGGSLQSASAPAVVGTAFVCVTLAVAASACSLVHAQTQAGVKTTGPKFEVASIRAVPMTGGGTPSRVGITINASRVDIGYWSLKQLLLRAYGLASYQLSAPEWVNELRFDVAADFPQGANRNQLPEMLQGLLKERFGLAAHRETRELSVFALTMDGGPPRMKRSVPDADNPTDSVSPNQLERAGRTLDNLWSRDKPFGLSTVSVTNGLMHSEFKKMPMDGLAQMLADRLRAPVIDATGLEGDYQVSLDLPMPGSSGPDGELGEPVFAAVRRLGLKLERRKAPIALLVVDRLERVPTEN